MASRDLRNISLNALGESIWGLMSNLVAPATVMTILLLRHGASNAMVGAVEAFGLCFTMLPQVIGIFLFHSRRDRKTRLILWHVMGMLPFLLIMGLLTFSVEKLGQVAYRWSLLVCYGAFCFSLGMVVAAWFDFIAGLFSIRIRGTAMGIAYFFSSLLGTGGALLGGWILERWPQTDTFGWLYITAAILGMGSMICWLFVDCGVDAAETEKPPPTYRELKAKFRESLAHQNFRDFLVGRILATCGFCITAFIAAYYLTPGGTAD